MKFAITQEVDNKAYDKSFKVQEISSGLEIFLKKKSYGKDIEAFLISFVAVKTKPGYEKFFKERKPKYIDYKAGKNRITGEPMETIKEYSYDLKFDDELYDEFVNSADEECKKLVAKKILESFQYLQNLPTKVKDFDKEKFIADVKQFFKNQGLL